MSKQYFSTSLGLVFVFSPTIKNTSQHIAFRSVLLALCSLLFFVQSKGQLKANFQADQLIGCPPFVVQFTDLSTGNPTSYFWDLGNGTTSTQQNPGTIYFNSGYYTIKLVVRSGTSVDSVTKSQYVFVSNVPDTKFQVSDSVGCSPLLIQFDDFSTPGSGNIASWEWDFGDGTTSSSQSPQHLFTSAGDFTITLRVTNSNGCVTTLIKPLFIHVDPSPIADFTSTSLSGCTPPVSINFSNAITGSYNNVSWNFGDGNTSTNTNPSHSYNAAGNYNVKLTVSNSFGCTDTISKVVVIGAVSVDFTYPDSVCEGASASFINTSSGSVSSSWSFGDGTTSTVQNPRKTYNSPGTFTVKLINNFGGCIDSTSKPIVVVPKPVAGFTFVAPPSGCSVPINVKFTSTSTGANTYLWDFGDAKFSNAPNPSHAYTSLGSYTVKLIITNKSGCTDTIVKQNIINVLPPKITGLDNIPYRGCAPHTQLFKANITSPEPVQSYLWNFGDGTSSIAATPTKTYSAQGIYNVTLKITTVSGCKDTFFYKGAIIIGNKPTANFTANPLNVCAHETIKFTDLSTGAINFWNWTFGDQGSSSQQNPLYNYIDTGFFSVRLVVGNNYCFDTIRKKNFVYIKPPVAKDSISFNCANPFTRNFTDKSIGALTINWDFGDGNTSTLQNPTHTYTSPGVYYARLDVTNGACFDFRIDTIFIIDEKPDFKHDSLICKNSPLLFAATNVNAANIFSYTWNFGDGSPPSAFTNFTTTTKKYALPGIYTPTLITTDKNGCKDTIKHVNGVNVIGPKAGFTNPAGGCAKAPVTFTNTSTPYSVYPIAKWIWIWGDGKKDTLTTPPFNHVYTNAGRYTVQLIVTDVFGCTDSIVKQNTIQITNPLASFSVTDSISCKNSNITFTNNSIGTNLTHLWTFGDGNSSNAISPTHSYSVQGNYTVLLKVTDRYGCTDTATLSNGITVSNPSVSFLMSDSFITCPPAQIKFKNTSTAYSSLRWDFDDGNFSTLDSPAHFFKTAKTFFIKLVANGFGSCKDSLIKKVEVKGPSGTFSYNPLSKCVPASINFAATATNTQFYVWDFGDGTTNASPLTTTTHVYATQGRYIPKLLLQDTTLNCIVPVIGNDTIYVTGGLSLIKSFPPAFCDSAVVQFFDSSTVLFDTIATRTWTFSDGTKSNLQNPTHRFSTVGNYTVSLKVTTKGGCVDSTTKPIKMVASPKAVIVGKDSVCVNDSIYFSGKLSVPDTSAIQWAWTFANGLPSSLQVPPAVAYPTAGPVNIKLRVTNSTGCFDTVLKRIIVVPLPNVDAGLDTTICKGKSIKLIPTGAATYIWQTNPTLTCSNCTSPLATPLDSIVVYRVTGRSMFGCKNIDSVTIRVSQPFNITASANQSICIGQKIPLNVKGTDNYTWSPATNLDNAFSSNPTANPDTTTTYRVVGEDKAKCFTDTAFVTVKVFPIPVVNIVPDNVTLAIGSDILLATTSSSDVNAWQWSPPNFLTCTNCPQPTAKPTTSITYKAVVSNAGGCTATDFVTIQLTCGSGNLYIPNTFSPNNDGMNDVFFPRGKGITGIKQFTVFNRWGNIVFQKSNFAVNDVSSGWNGTYKNQPASSDVYVYQIEVICGTGDVFVTKGNVTLLR